MTADKHTSKGRWFVRGCVGLVAIWLLGVAVHKAYRHYTLPQRVANGRMLFEHVWQPSDELCDGGDGLGPVFNERSCVACHFQGGVGGGGPTSKNVAAFEVLPFSTGSEVLGGVVHASAIRPELQESFERVAELFPIVRGARTVVNGCVTRQADFNPVVRASVNTPALFGAGLIDGLSGWSIHGDGLRRSAAVIANELSADFSDTTVGRVRTLSAGRVGKFGWKGQFATLKDFVATACAVEVGLTNSQKQQMLPGEFRADPNAALDMTDKQLDELVSYIAALPRPIEVLPDDPSKRKQAIRGKGLFTEVGCAECHTPDLGNVEGIYSDFRLYEIEPKGQSGYSAATLPDTLPADHPKPGEWQTPPLWGVADSAPYFHDGASTTLQGAIARHGGSAKKSRERYESLPGSDRLALIAFLGTLKAPR